MHPAFCLVVPCVLPPGKPDEGSSFLPPLFLILAAEVAEAFELAAEIFGDVR
jgi:hypothetical protein